MVDSTVHFDRQTKTVIRLVALSILVAFWVCIVLFNPAGMILDTNSAIIMYGPYVWFGAFIALPGLFGVWLALGNQRPTVRLLQVAGLAAFMGVAATWAYGRARPQVGIDLDFLLILLSVTVFQGLALLLMRYGFNWRLELQRYNKPKRETLQRVSQVLLWMASVAGLIVLSISVVVSWRAIGKNLSTTGWLGGSIAVLLFSAVSLPLLILSVMFVLGDGRRKRVNVWLYRTVILVLLPMCALIFGMGIRLPYCSTFLQHLRDNLLASLMPVAFVTGYLLALVGSLAVLRLSGFRFQRDNENVLSGI